MLAETTEPVKRRNSQHTHPLLRIIWLEFIPHVPWVHLPSSFSLPVLELWSPIPQPISWKRHQEHHQKKHKKTLYPSWVAKRTSMAGGLTKIDSFKLHCYSGRASKDSISLPNIYIRCVALNLHCWLTGCRPVYCSTAMATALPAARPWNLAPAASTQEGIWKSPSAVTPNRSAD